jgi:hypothetical protein
VPVDFSAAHRTFGTVVEEGFVMEAEAIDPKILIAKLILWSLVGFDILLGGLSLVAPRLVMKTFAPDAEPAGEPLLRRAATIWAFFVPIQLWAAIKTENPTALRAVSVLRLQEVPADPMWLATGEGFGFLGKFGLVFAPIFNLIAGAYLWWVARQLENEGA